MNKYIGPFVHYGVSFIYSLYEPIDVMLMFSNIIAM